MQGWKLLKLFFDGDNAQSLQLLKDKASLKPMLEDTSLVIFLRYLQNLDQYDMETTLKTLLLLLSFLFQNRPKMRNLLPFQKIACAKLQKQTNHQLQALVVCKIVQYVNYLIARSDAPEGIGQQFQLCTKNLLKVYHFMEYKSTAIVKYAKAFYWLVEQRLYSYWLRIKRELLHLESLQAGEYRVFYEGYCNFWKYKRKIPKVMHRNLKSVEVSLQENERIEQRYRQLLRQTESSPSSYFSEERLSKMVNLTGGQFEDD